MNEVLYFSSTKLYQQIHLYANVVSNNRINFTVILLISICPKKLAFDGFGFENIFAIGKMAKELQLFKASRLAFNQVSTNWLSCSVSVKIIFAKKLGYIIFNYI